VPKVRRTNIPPALLQHLLTYTRTEDLRWATCLTRNVAW